MKRLRELAIKQKTALSNQIKGLLLAFNVRVSIKVPFFPYQLTSIEMACYTPGGAAIVRLGISNITRVSTRANCVIK
jgi:hypothetical protein